MKKTILLSLLIAASGLTLSVRAGDATEVWDKACAKCHGKDGKGETKIGKKAEVKDFTDAKVQAAFTDDQGFKAVKEGLKDGEKIKMKPAEGVTDEQIKDLIKKVRTFKK